VRFRRRGRPAVAINIAPLVDVVFLLVIFFAVSTTFEDTAGLELELPDSTSRAERPREEIAVALASDGTIAFRGATVTPDELSERLREALADAEDKNVVLRADTHTEHGQVVDLMDRIRNAGAEGLTVAARGGGPDTTETAPRGP